MLLYISILLSRKALTLFEVSLKMVDGWSEKIDVAKEFETHIKSFPDFASGEVRFDVSVVNDIPRSPTGKLLSVTSDLKGSLR